MASVTGTFSRYGEGNNILEMSSGAAAASGMQMGQFGEFVESLKSVFENAISNGMIKGADKIAQSMVLLEKLSGGSELWKGEQGASRFLQMSDTISQATKLMSPTDILSYRAASGIAGTYLSGTGEWEKQFGSKRGGDYVDNMLILESGLSPALMLAQKKMVESVAGEGNRAGQVEQYRQMYGLNYTGAAQVYEMMGKLGTEGYGEEDITNKIEAMQKDPQYLSNELNMLKTVEDIRTEVTKTGQTMSDIKTDMMSPVKSVVGWVANKAQDNLYGDMARGATQGLFSAGVKEDDKAREAMQRALIKGMGGTKEEKVVAWEIYKRVTNLEEAQKMWGDTTNILHNIDWSDLPKALDYIRNISWGDVAAGPNANKEVIDKMQKARLMYGENYNFQPFFDYHATGPDDLRGKLQEEMNALVGTYDPESEGYDRIYKSKLQGIAEMYQQAAQDSAVDQSEYNRITNKFDELRTSLDLAAKAFRDMTVTVE